MKTLRIIVGVVLFATAASAQCAFKYNPLSPFLAYVCAGTTGPGIGGASSLTGTGGVLYDASAGTAGVSTGFLRTGVGKYTLYDPTATTGSTAFTIKSGAGQASTNLFDVWLNTAGSTPGVHVTSAGLLGAGTATPSVLVHMKSSSGPAFRLERTGYTPRFDVENDGTNLNIVQQDTGAYSVNFKRGSTRLMTIANNGKIGVNSATKLSQFTVTPPADATNIGGTTSVNASTTINGSGTTFLTSLGIGDRISLSSAAATYATVTAIASDTSLTVDSALGNGTSQTINRKSSIFRLDDASNATKFVVADNGNVVIGGLDLGVSRTAAGLLQINSGTAGKWGGMDLGVLNLKSLATPTGLTVTPTCAADCSATWGYRVVAYLADGTTSTAAAAEVTTAAQNATLDGSNHNVVTWSAVTGATNYAVFRTTVATSPATTGRLAGCTNITGLSCDDTGLAGDSASAPTSNATATVTVAGTPGVTASGTTCTITSIVGGIIVGATCTP